jgi:hypothetical protein
MNDETAKLVTRMRGTSIPAIAAAIEWSRTATNARPWRVRKRFFVRRNEMKTQPRRK